VTIELTIDHLRKPLQIGSKHAPNRVVYQPTESNTADKDGNVSDTTLGKYVELAKGKPGVLYVESLDVTRETQARSNRLLIMKNNKKGLERLVGEIRKENGDTLVLFQLSHAGRLSDPSMKPPLLVYEPRAHLPGAAGLPAGGRVMRTDEIERTKKEFVESAVVAYEAGVDGIDMKQAHGFVAGDFLHPANRRPDGYGGSFENRTRFFRETVSGIKKALGAAAVDGSFLIGTRISPYEGIMGGCGTSGPDDLEEDLREMVLFARMIEEEGLHFINVSGGYASGNLEILMPTAAYPEGVFRLFGWTRTIKEAVRIPVIGSGYSYLRDGENRLFGHDAEKKCLLYWAEKNVREGRTDLIGIGRQAIADPHFAAKALCGRQREIDYCTACGGCGFLLGNNRQVGCVVYDERYREIYRSLR
jgi:2,4-dienoyl-CoA reductase-like NADH-dependent reductase (Old Yellow Enzyme family)